MTLSNRRRLMLIIIQFIKQKIIEIGQYILFLSYVVLIILLFIGLSGGLVYGIQYMLGTLYGYNFLVGFCVSIIGILILGGPIVCIIDLYKWLKDNWIRATKVIDSKYNKMEEPK